jgi:CDP-glucose 4,6-dehydratase
MTEGAFRNFYRGKTVLVTGHTGFKGSWLTIWLRELGAKVVGVALDPPTEPNHFSTARLSSRMTHVESDVRDMKRLQAIFAEHRPEVVFHLAAQAVVRRSFVEPRRTFEVNVMGTVNVLDASARCETVRGVVMVTSDKCYRNVGGDQAYREGDELGGLDPYGASKACAELVTAVYQDSRFQEASSGRALAIASVRAGNVIGGGDWASYRIIPDTVRAITTGTDVFLRLPGATRPWQHVLEPLSGYLWLGALLIEAPEHYASAWNFAPRDPRLLTVGEIVTRVLELWSPDRTRLVVEQDDSGIEALRLVLDWQKARTALNWEATWDVDEALKATVEWYRRVY